ncbi:MAG: hypothetical protein ACI4W2_00765 [Eubacterium sp.]
MTENRIFEEMQEAGYAYQEAKDKRLEIRTELIKADKWDEVRAFDEKEKAEHPFPFTKGAMKALQAYRNSRQRGSDAFEVEDMAWPDDTKDFVETLRKAGIMSIVVTEQSTGLMDGIYDLTACGCRMAGLKTVTRADDFRFGSREPETKRGIEFEIN